MGEDDASIVNGLFKCVQWRIGWKKFTLTASHLSRGNKIFWGPHKIELTHKRAQSGVFMKTVEERWIIWLAEWIFFLINLCFVQNDRRLITLLLNVQLYYEHTCVRSVVNCLLFHYVTYVYLMYCPRHFCCTLNHKPTWDCNYFGVTLQFTDQNAMGLNLPKDSHNRNCLWLSSDSSGRKPLPIVFDWLSTRHLLSTT
jgi:hypothetical protein